MSLFEELKRRNVVRMAMLYLVASWVILQVADVLVDALELPAVWSRGVLAVLALGFPLALIFSWVYEMTPEGIKREKDVDRSQSVTPETGRKINILIVVLLVTAIATVAVDRLLPETTPVTVTETIVTEDQAGTADPVQLVAEKFAPAADRSIAVLPFANRSAREEDVFFVDGIHDDILTQLARIGSLTVISRTSVEKFRGTDQNMKDIGAALGVKNILEGGVQRAGDRVRINVQLIDVTTDVHLWAETYDRELTTSNIFAIQSEISTAIAEALRATLSPEEKEQLDSAQTGNLAALEAYFIGRQQLAKRTSTSLAEAERQFKQAIELDPDYALAYVGLADTYNLQVSYSGLAESAQEALAEPLIARALALNNRLGEAYISMATLADDDPDAQEKLYRKGVELAPGYVTGHQWYGGFLSRRGDLTEALAQLEEAVRLDPLSGIVRISMGGVLESLGRFDEAREQYEAALRIDPGFAAAYTSLGALDAFTGRFDDAMVQLRQAAALDPGNPQNPVVMAIAWSLVGGDAEADRILAGTEEASAWWSGWATSYIKANRGDLAAAAADTRIVLAEVPTESTALWISGLHDLHSGRTEVAIQRYESAYPSLSDKAAPVVDGTNYFAAVNLAYFLQAIGDERWAGRLLDAALAYVETVPRLGSSGHGITDVKIYAMQGQTDRALAALREAVDQGWILMNDFDEDLAPLYDEPEYQAMMDEIKAKQAEQLKRLRAMEANGELAPIPAATPAG